MNKTERFFMWFGMVVALYCFFNGLCDITFTNVVPFVSNVLAMVNI